MWFPSLEGPGCIPLVRAREFVSVTMMHEAGHQDAIWCRCPGEIGLDVAARLDLQRYNQLTTDEKIITSQDKNSTFTLRHQINFLSRDVITILTQPNTLSLR